MLINQIKILLDLTGGNVIRPILCAIIMLASNGQVNAEETVYSPMDYNSAKNETMDWLKSKKVDSKIIEKIQTGWGTETTFPDEILDLTISSFQQADLDTKRFVERCVFGKAPFVPQGHAILEQDGLSDFYRANLGLYYGQYLARRELYDEAMAVLKKTDVKHVIDPAAYFFYLAICQHRLFLKSDSLETINQLLEHTEQVPARYQDVARLMKYELEQIKEKSIGEISHKMGDSRRRLDLGHGGPKIQKVQDEILALLDKLIKKKEQQSKSSSSSSGSGGNQSGDLKPAEESRIKGSVAPGDVDEKTLIKQGGWGGLPPKEEAKAKSMINRRFPAHYREAVEKYFKKLATRRAEPVKNNE